MQWALRHDGEVRLRTPDIVDQLVLGVLKGLTERGFDFTGLEFDSLNLNESVNYIQDPTIRSEMKKWVKSNLDITLKFTKLPYFLSSF
jgi:hypothetical protein